MANQLRKSNSGCLLEACTPVQTRTENGVQMAEHHLPCSLEGAGVKGSNGPNESDNHLAWPASSIISLSVAWHSDA